MTSLRRRDNSPVPVTAHKHHLIHNIMWTPMFAIDLPFVIISLTGLVLSWMLAVVFTRLYLDPLSKIPGPKLAAASHLYELYHDIWLGGRLPWKIKELHATYGPVVRIAPDEVHVADHDYANRHLSTRSDKPAHHQHRMGFGLATSETPDFMTHKMRYNALAPSFSRRAVADLEPLIKAKVDKVCKRLEEHRFSCGKKAGDPIDLRKLFLCMTTDTLTTFAFGFSFDLLDDPDLAPEWRATLDAGIRSIQLFKHFPIGRRLLRHPLISPMILKLKPGLAVIQSFEQQNKQIAHQAMAECGYADKSKQPTLAEREVKSSAAPDQLPRNTIFHQLLSGDLPAEEKSHARLWQEASSLMAAGTETTANILSFITFHLHDNPTCLTRLKDELSRAMPNRNSPLPSWPTTLEPLPYLSAVISEGLRLALSVTGRMMRVLPQGTEIHGHLVSRGTVVSVSTIMLHMDETAWPEPEAFRPERFLDTEEESGRGARKDLFAFSKGSRACLGMNLAYAQLYLTLAGIISRFDMKLYETDLHDVKPEFDGIVALTRPGSKGVRVVVE